VISATKAAAAGERPRVSRHGRIVGILFTPFWVAAAALNLMPFLGA
jgi:hypothetical protein